jgi:uncharacterized protein with von Willebrand factor type A (vWA) domain
MKPTLNDLIARLIGHLRRDGVAVSVAEAVDAARAAVAVGVERHVLRDALAATLVKDEADRAVFLAAFERVFPATPRAAAVAKERRRGGRGGAGAGDHAGGAAGETGAGTRTSGPPSDSEGASPASRAGRRDIDGEPRHPATRRSGREDAADDDEGASSGAHEEEGSGAVARRARDRSLLRLPFRAMTPADVDACAELARAIATRVTARVRRRLAPRPSGRLDFRRTIRAAVPRGGVPFERRWRSRRPGAPDLVAAVDLSMSTATASEFFLALLAPAAAYFRHVHLFGFVDRLVAIEFVAGQVRPAGPLDVMARSDFGRVLRDLVEDHATVLGPDTVLLVLGDARNNRRPPRADLLAAARARVRRALWLNPEPRERWNSGDSVIASYARHVDAVVACGTLAELERALAAVTTL